MANWYADRDHHPMGPELCPVQRRTPTRAETYAEIGLRVNASFDQFRRAFAQVTSGVVNATAPLRAHYTLAGPGDSDA